MTHYLNTLKPDDVRNVETRLSSTKVKSRNVEQIKSQELMKISSIAGSRNLFITTDVIDCDIPLLFSKKRNEESKNEHRFCYRYCINLCIKTKIIVYIIRLTLCSSYNSG